MARLHRIFLVGPMGAGKSTIGKYLAQHLKLRFADTDSEIEARTGADIPWIFDVEGEAGFRDREVRMIDTLTRKKGIVLATGGGAVLAKKTRKRLCKRGKVVYLRATIAQQIERTSRDKNRPLLQTDDPKRTIRELMEQREPLYLEIADIIVDTNRRSSRAVSKEIAQQLRLVCGED